MANSNVYAQENAAYRKHVVETVDLIDGKADDILLIEDKVDDIEDKIDLITAAVDAGFALTGDAEVGDVLDGVFFYKDDFKTKLEGTLALTGDAVVTEVANGKTFYADDAKTQLTGTSTAVETGDATAVEGDIASGKTAYVNGVKITGTAT